MYQLPKHTLPRAAHLWLTAALLAALVCSLTPQRVLPAAARPEQAAPPVSRNPSFDYAQDRPCDYAQDRPFDCAQDRSFAAWPPGLAATLAQALQDELPAAYHLARTAAGYRAENPVHNLQLDFTPAGLQVRNPSAGWQWRLSLRALGYAGAVQPVPPAELAAGRTRLEYRRGPGLTEWYLNSPWGLEQGFTVAAPPVAPPGGGQRAGLVLELALGGSLTPRLDGATVLLAEGSGQVVARYTGLTAWDASGRQLPAALSVAPHTIAILVDDSAARYPLTIDPWVQLAKLTASDGAAGDEFGYSVAISGDTVVVGAYRDDSKKGSAYVFVRPGGGWATTSTYTARLTASDGAANDYFGYSVAISGDTVVVGAYGDDSGRGSAYVFVRPAGGWATTSTYTAKLTASDRAANDYFGYSVAISGDTVVVGAYGDDSGGNADQGSAYIFGNLGSIIVDKVTNPGGDSASFAFTLSGGPSNLNQSFGLTDADPPYDSGAVLPGSGYKVTETVPSGWNLTGATCSDGSPLDNVALSAGETVTCTFTNTKQVTLTVNRTGTGNGTVTSNPAGINCGADCTETYNGNTVVALTATPAAGSFFAGWSGDCSGTDPTTSVTMNADKTCTATFNKADTTTTITADNPDPSVVGQAVVVAFTVTANAPGSGTPTGNVTVSDGVVSCMGTVAAGQCTLTFTSAGAKTLTATYAGDANFNGSSDTEPHTVNKANTTTTLTTWPSSAPLGQVVTFTATVTAQAPGAGTPTGSVTFLSDGNVIPGCNAVPLNAAAQATCITSLRSMTAEYSGDTCFNGSTGTLKLQPVGGYLVPVSRLDLLAPWLGLAALALVIAAVVVRRRVA